MLHLLDAGRAAMQVGEGDFLPPETNAVGGPDEITEFADDFDKMARQLEALHRSRKRSAQPNRQARRSTTCCSTRSRAQARASTA